MSATSWGIALKVQCWPQLREDFFDAAPKVYRSSAYWVAAGIAAHQNEMMNVILQEFFLAGSRRCELSGDPGQCSFFLSNKSFANEISRVTYDGVDCTKASVLFKEYRCLDIPKNESHSVEMEVVREYVCLYLKAVIEADNNDGGSVKRRRVDSPASNVLDGINPIACVHAHVDFVTTITFLASIPEIQARWREVSMIERVENKQMRKELNERMGYVFGPLNGKKPNRCNVATLLHALNAEIKRQKFPIELDKLSPNELLVWFTDAPRVVVQNTQERCKKGTWNIASSSEGYDALILNGADCIDESSDEHTLMGFVYKKPSGEHVVMYMFGSQWIELDPSGKKCEGFNDWMFEDHDRPGIFHWNRTAAKIPGNGTAIEPTLQVVNDWRDDSTIAESAVLAYYRHVEQ